jgi:glycosyltransferase involved in cell wall biosynthesis
MSTSKTAICFVTNELYPLGPGGIGRMLYNFAKYNEEVGLPADVHFLVPRALVESRADALDLLQSTFQDIATIHVCPSLASTPTPIAQLLARAEQHPWTSEWLFGDSYRYYLGLRAAEERRGSPFDIIEFPDFGGWGVASIEAKRAGLAFADTLITARVHSTQGILYAVERFAHDPGHWAGIMFDAERHLFNQADLIVGHDPQIIKHTARFYGLEERWGGRAMLEFPPVFVSSSTGSYERADKIVVPRDEGECADFIFSSRLQPVKRPDLYIRAAILFLERHPDHPGIFRLVCNGWDRDFVDGLKSLIPEDMVDRIVFLEKAPPTDRLHYVQNSIVVIPSDYESLCLFAFEAALAGRKVILNGACPAFGNGFRWRDSENCLLFDGSVESLAMTMEKSLSWEACSTVDVVPSRPYWIDDAVLPLAPRPPARHLKEGIAVLCYGAQSPTEFNRHFDLACDVAAELTDANQKHEIIFLLPRGSFSADGPESEAIRGRGWRLVFSSGVRECPQMFGKRIVNLGKDAVFLLPFGYEVLPGFVSSAVEVLRSEPSVAIVSGHIDLVDPHTGRSDCIRTYSGEAPSSALLSSRIAPPLCLLNTSVLERVTFDPLAGTFWFEVFARTCALNGESIVIIPVIAGTLDALMQQQLETTKRVAAGLLDQLGIASGWQARLLSVDPVQIPSTADGRPMSYDARRMRDISRINPTGRVRSWEPVGWQESAQGALVHPLEGHVTIGEVAGPYRRVSRIVGHVRNVRHDNAGADVAIALARSHVDVEQMLQIIHEGGNCDAVALSPWKSLGAGQAIRIEAPCYSVSKGNDKVLLITRPRKGSPEENTEIVFTGIDFHFNNLSIG